jgi:hypothetical protein
VKPHKLNHSGCMIRLRISSDIFRSGNFFMGARFFMGVKKLWGKKIMG